MITFAILKFQIALRQILNLPFVLLLAVLFCACTQDPKVDPEPTEDEEPVPDAMTVINAMGTGFNLGNTFDYAQHSTTPQPIRPIMDLYYNTGMRHLRIPITWTDGFNGNTLADGNGSVDFQHPRFIQLDALIDYALELNMYVVLNTHHRYETGFNFVKSVGGLAVSNSQSELGDT